MIRSRMTGLSILALVLITGPSAAQVQVPQLIKIQGFLTNAGGVPTNGVVNMTFGLYDAQSGGTLINQLGPQPVTVNAGVYDVGLSFQASDFMGPNRFLEITVDGEVMTPRTKVGSVPYTYKADLGDAGLSCWDLNGDGGCTLPAEDVDQSGNCNVADCAGSQGPPGPTGPQGSTGPEGPPGPAGPSAGNVRAGVLALPPVPVFSGPIVGSAVVGFSPSFATVPSVLVSGNLSSVTAVTASEFTVKYTRPGYSTTTIESAGGGVFGSAGSLAVVDGNPAISYLHITQGDLKFVRSTDAAGGSWVTPVSIDTAGDVGWYSSLAVVAGNPAISYYDKTNGNLKYVRATDASGTSWGTPISIDTAGNVGEYTSLEVVAGNPAISYHDTTNGDLKYVRATDALGTSWGTPIGVDTTFAFVGQYTSLAVVAGSPAVSYYDATNGDLKYVRATDAVGSSWGTPIPIDAVDDVGRYASLAVVDGNPAIGYYDGTNSALKYVRATDASGINWGMPIFLDVAGDVGQYCSLAVIGGNPAISYYDTTNDDLKYTRATTASGTSWSAPSSTSVTASLTTSLLEIAGNPAISFGAQRFIGLPPAAFFVNWIAVEPEPAGVGPGAP